MCAGPRGRWATTAHSCEHIDKLDHRLGWLSTSQAGGAARAETLGMESHTGRDCGHGRILRDPARKAGWPQVGDSRPGMWTWVWGDKEAWKAWESRVTPSCP